MLIKKKVFNILTKFVFSLLVYIKKKILCKFQVNRMNILRSAQRFENVYEKNAFKVLLCDISCLVEKYHLRHLWSFKAKTKIRIFLNLQDDVIP